LGGLGGWSEGGEGGKGEETGEEVADGWFHGR
jgi:hypothetical protein